MNPSTQAVREARKRWLAFALCTASASLGLASSTRADDPSSPTIPAATRDDTPQATPGTTPEATQAAPTRAPEETVPVPETTPADGTASVEPKPDTPPAPDGAYIASVTANGTGCPAGTWDASISPHGDSLTLTLSRFELEVSHANMISVRDCQFNIALHGQPGLSFAVKNVWYSGYAFLEEDVNFRQLADYYFSGTPHDNAEARTELTGPYDDSFLFEDTRKDVDLVFSPCTTDQNLQVRVTARLRNSSPRGNGYVNIDKVRISGVVVKAC